MSSGQRRLDHLVIEARPEAIEYLEQRRTKHQQQGGIAKRASKVGGQRLDEVKQRVVFHDLAEMRVMLRG